MASRQSQFGLRRGIRTQLVSHQHVGREAVLFEQLAHQFHGCRLVASPLHQQIENLAFVVDRSPEPESPAGDQDCHLVQMPVRGWPRASTPKFLGEQRPELQHPSSNRFIGDVQPALGQQIFDIAEAEGKAKIQPQACRMMSGGNWWRANEISIGHLTREIEVGDRWRDKTVYSAGTRGLGRRTRKRVSDAKFWVPNHAAGLISEIALGLRAPVER